MSKQLRADEGGRPWCVQVELVTGCNFKSGSGLGGLCHFCGIQALRSGPGNYEYIPLETVERVVSQMVEFCPNARVEFALRGEPLMHPKAAEILAMFRKAIPHVSLMLTTNGETLRGHMQQRMEKLFSNGLNLMILDTYYPKERRDALREEAYSLTGVQVVDFFKDWVGTGQSPYSRQSPERKMIVLMDDLAVMDGVHSSRQVKTHAGSNPTKDHSTGFPLKRNCGRPFRELIIHADGTVPLCCDSWDKQRYTIGNVNEMTFKEIWAHPNFEAARARLMQKDRSFGPCQKCDAPSASRSGLLPDYDAPTTEQVALTESLWSK